MLVDARHGLKDADDAVLDTLGQAAVSHQIVLTKAMQVKPSELERPHRRSRGGAGQAPGRLSRVLATSSHDGAGIPELRAAIARLLDGKKGPDALS